MTETKVPTREEVESLRESYLKQLPAKIEAIQRAVHQMRSGHPPACQEAQVLSHRLAGSASIYGLAQVSAAARALEEAVCAEGEDPSGAVAGRVDQAMATLRACAERSLDGRPLRVLLVDDDPDVLEFLALHLRAAGLTVRTAVNGDTALELIATDEPDVIVADIRMPDMDGLELCRRLRSSGHRDLPFVFCSALGSLSERIEGLKAGADDYIVKPADNEEFVLRVRGQAERRRRMLELREQLEDHGASQVLSGNSTDVAPAEVLQIIGLLRLREVRVTFESGDAAGRVWVSDGRLVHASLRELQGLKAFQRLLGFRFGRFRIDHEVFSGTATIDEVLEPALMDALARMDEARALRGALGAAREDLALTGDPAVLSRRFDDGTAEVIDLVARHGRLERVLDESPHDDLDTLRIVSCLVQTGVLVSRDGKREPA